MTRRWLLTPALCIGLFAPDVRAADIASSVGRPGTTDWDDACIGPQTEPPAIPSDYYDCDALGLPVAYCMHRVDIDTTPGAFPLATCNDGTPATFYIREGIGDYADRWVIHLEGGAGCRDHESCLDRWCGADGFYTAAKMSSDWDGDGTPNLPDHALIENISTFHPDNDFSAWTHVYIPYCTSDAWLGRATDVTLSDGVDAFDIDVRGHSILQAVRRMLRQKAPGDSWMAQGDFTVPDIDDAAEILFTGTSAGGIGALQNADWFLEIFDDSTNGLVIDGGLDILESPFQFADVWVDLDGDGIGDSRYAEYRRDAMLADWAPGGLYDEINAFVDESCRAVYEPMVRMDRCAFSSTVLMLNTSGAPMIETPTFVRQDLEDNVLSFLLTDPPGGETLLVGGSSGAPMTLEDYAEFMRETLEELYDDHDTVSGVYGPRCGKHVGLPSLVALGADTTPDTDDSVSPPALISGTESTFHDALGAWFGPGGTFVDTRHIDTEEGAAYSTCY